MTYAAFEAQYRATGREKADGYAPALFEGMSPTEKAQAAELLTKELEVTPGIAAEGLVYLDKETARARLAAFAEKRPNMSCIHQVYVWLFRLTEDPAYVDKMLESYPLALEVTRPGFMLALSEMPASEQVIDFVRTIILEDKDSMNRALAAKIYLDRFGRYSDDRVGAAERAGHLSLLRDGSPTTRKSIMERIAGTTGAH